MHSQLALTELPSPNLAPFLLLDPVLYEQWAKSGRCPMFEAVVVSHQGGFLEEQDRAGTASHRALYYSVESGRFSLYIVSHAEVKCEMDFDFYPFDTQKCQFRMSSTADLEHLVRDWHYIQIQGDHAGLGPGLG